MKLSLKILLTNIVIAIILFLVFKDALFLYSIFGGILQLFIGLLMLPLPDKQHAKGFLLSAILLLLLFSIIFYNSRIGVPML